MRRLYATDASAYREIPLAVAIPENLDDIQKLIAFARNQGTSLIPRAAGTSLAGQVVGRARTGRAVVKAPWRLAHPLDEFLEVTRVILGIDHQHLRHIGHQN